jgi:hypothetical protein
LSILVPDAPLGAEGGETSASIVANEQVSMIIQAVNASGQVVSVNRGVSVTPSRTLDASETGLPSSFTLSNGMYVHGVTLNRVNGTDRGTTFRFRVTGLQQNTDFFLYTYFRVTATKEGLVGGTTACGHTIQSNDHFVALPSTGYCNVGVIVRNGNSSDTTTVQDVGPWYPHSNATSGNPCVGPNDPYWNTGGIPRVVSQSCDANDSALDMGDGTASAVGISGIGSVVWRFQ